MKAVSLRGLALVAFVTLIGTGAFGIIEYPSGTETFEAMTVGDPVQSIGWLVVNDPAGTLTVTARNDVLGVVGPRGDSTRWLRVIDNDSVNSNRFYSDTVVAPSLDGYEWTYYVNLETTPPGGASVKPKFTIQHLDNGSTFANAWGVEFTSTGANLIVLGIGGTAASTPLYSLTSPTAVGDWVKITFRADFHSDTVRASYNNNAAVSLPMNLAGTADPNTFRFCYRGEGSGNVQTLLLDDPRVAVMPAVPAVSEWGLVVLTLLVLAAGSVLVLRSRRLELQA